MSLNIIVFTLIIFIIKVCAWPPFPGKTTGDNVVHDPAMIRKGNEYYIFSTHNNIEIRTSTDRVKFKKIGSAIPWVGSNDVWAPDVSFHNSEYWLLYATSKFGTQDSCIYLATSSTMLPGTWKDKGKVICSKKGDEYNAIDPNIIKDISGNLWLTFGSWYGGIYIVGIDKNVKTKDTPKLIARRPDGGNPLEGPNIYVHNKKYYLFMSTGNCCVDSKGIVGNPHEPYHITVCRSNLITGPYLDASGKSCTQGGRLEFLTGQKGIWGVGGQGVLKDDKDIVYYHYYDSNDKYVSKLGINYITWDKNDWPIAY